MWLIHLAKKNHQTTHAYIQQVLLRHLYTTPGIDLSQSPSSEPKGVSNEQEDRGKP